MTESRQVRDIVGQIINRVLTDTGRSSRDFHDDDTLTGTISLDSLDLAVMVVSLEQSLGVDPFRSGAQPVQAFGQLVALYESTVNSTPS